MPVHGVHGVAPRVALKGSKWWAAERTNAVPRSFPPPRGLPLASDGAEFRVYRVVHASTLVRPGGGKGRGN